MGNSNYSRAISQACKFIQNNLNDDLNLEIIAQSVNLSKYHFQRIFTIYTQTTPYSYIKLSRLKKASYQLALQKELKIIDIALEAKYESQEAFTRSFKKVFKITPKKFRDNPDWKAWNKKYNYQIPTMEKSMNVEIIDFQAIPIAYLTHKGPHELLNVTISKFIEWRKDSGQSPIDQCKTFGLVYADPFSTPPEDFEFDVCAEFTGTISNNHFGVKTKTIPTGKCAKVRHFGAHDLMNEKIYSLYRDWLPKSGKELRDYPLFFHYHNVLPLVNESELVTDIYLPIK